MMNKHWQLREELYRAFHNWPLLVAFFLLGALLGWLAGYVWPPYYRATREVYVALNPYRTYSDARFLALAKPRYSNIDNYHYWQMNQLETVIYRDRLVRTALENLRREDPYWNAVDEAQFRRMLDAEWRTAGAWRLTAAHADPQRARQAALAWSDLATQSAAQAITAARETLVLDQQLTQAAAAQLENQLRVKSMIGAEQSLRAWLETAAGLDPAAALPPDLRWQVFSLTTAYATDDPAWQALLADQPAPDAPVSTFLSWAQAALGRLQAELAVLPAQTAALEAENAGLKERFKTAADDSLGLSPNLDIESFGEIEIRTVRPASTLALVGGFVGLLAWLLAQVGRATRPMRMAAEPQDG